MHGADDAGRDLPEAAVLAGSLGAFRFRVLRYEFPEPDHGLDWLVTHVAWDGKSVRVDHSGPDMEAGALRVWADDLTQIVDSLRAGKREFDFIEPNIVMACEKSGPRGHFDVTLEIHGEPAMVGEHFSVEFEVDQGELRGFAAALRAWADRFPHRGDRASGRHG